MKRESTRRLALAGMMGAIAFVLMFLSFPTPLNPFAELDFSALPELIGGFILGVEFVGGILVGATIVAIPRAIFMGNSGGAFDNAKKYIEQGMLKGHGKGSPAHKASVTGDTIGDTRKDVVGVALDIFIKLMSTVANTIAPIIRNFRLFG